MVERRNKIIVIPCSGIGKAFGTIGREAAHIVVDETRPETTDTVCLSALVMGDEETRARVRGQRCITIDGCPTGCARKNVEMAGGTVARALRVVDTYKAHHDLKPKAVTELDDAGCELAQILAQQVAEEADRIQEEQ